VIIISLVVTLEAL